ncbi:MAG: TfoX/Sxy family protein [Gammaproteobacteria bacterium]|nr:TfoX/Sxy family protein [Gammaproteobacteria bacterium]
MDPQMPYDESLADRVRETLSKSPEVVERKMMGGLVFMVNQHMCCGVTGTSLMVRVGKDAYEKSLAKPNVSPLDIGGGRQPKAFVLVAPEAIKNKKSLQSWIKKGLAFVETLPAKK